MPVSQSHSYSWRFLGLAHRATEETVLVSWTVEMVHQLSLLIVGLYAILAVPKASEAAHQHHQTLLVLLRSPVHFAKPIQHVSLLGRFCASVRVSLSWPALS